MTNVGADSTSNDSVVMTLSDSRYWRIALHAPITTPSTAPSTLPMTTRRRLTPMSAPQLVGDRLTGDRGAEVAAHRPRDPVRVTQRDRLVQIEFGGLGVR